MSAPEQEVPRRSAQEQEMPRRSAQELEVEGEWEVRPDWLALLLLLSITPGESS